MRWRPLGWLQSCTFVDVSHIQMLCWFTHRYVKHIGTGLVIVMLGCSHPHAWLSSSEASCGDATTC